MDAADSGVKASSASKLKVQRPRASRLALFLVLDHPSQAHWNTRAPASRAHSTVPSVLPESKMTTSSATPFRDASNRGRLLASLHEMTTTLRSGVSVAV